MNKTNIEYLDYTWNITHGCSPISPGCAHCWAEETSKGLARMGMRGYSKDDPFKVVCCPWKLDEPLKVKKPSRIGVSFMGDLFHEDVPDDFILKIFQTMCRGYFDGGKSDWTHPHTFLVLTKRPKRMAQFWKKQFHDEPCPESVCLGVTVENPDYLWRIDELVKIPAASRFVSFEPLLGEVNATRYLAQSKGTGIPFQSIIDWAIIGAESGSNRRACDIQWAGDICFQLRAANIPVFIKQLHINGKLSKNLAEWPEDLRIQEHPHATKSS